VIKESLVSLHHQFVVAFQMVHVSNVPPHCSHPKPQVSGEIRGTNREPLQESLCVSVTASQSLKGLPALKLIHFSNLSDPLKAHTHSKRKLGHTNTTTGYYSYYKG